MENSLLDNHKPEKMFLNDTLLPNMKTKSDNIKLDSIKCNSFGQFSINSEKDSSVLRDTIFYCDGLCIDL